MANETAALDTPARRATSAIVGRNLRVRIASRCYRELNRFSGFGRPSRSPTDAGSTASAVTRADRATIRIRKGRRQQLRRIHLAVASAERHPRSLFEEWRVIAGLNRFRTLAMWAILDSHTVERR
jgi:hypothetical protein